MIRIETTFFSGSWCRCFGLHPSEITVFTPDRTNHTKREIELEFDLNGLQPVGVKALLVGVCLNTVFFHFWTTRVAFVIIFSQSQ